MKQLFRIVCCVAIIGRDKERKTFTFFNSKIFFSISLYLSLSLSPSLSLSFSLSLLLLLPQDGGRIQDGGLIWPSNRKNVPPPGGSSQGSPASPLPHIHIYLYIPKVVSCLSFSFSFFTLVLSSSSSFFFPLLFLKPSHYLSLHLSLKTLSVHLAQFFFTSLLCLGLLLFLFPQQIHTEMQIQLKQRMSSWNNNSTHVGDIFLALVKKPKGFSEV